MICFFIFSELIPLRCCKICVVRERRLPSCCRLRLRALGRDSKQLPSDNGAGLEHDFQIEQDRHVLEIEQIHRDHLVERRFVFPVYLPVSGQARQTVYAFPLPRFIMGKFIWRARAADPPDSSHREAR